MSESVVVAVSERRAGQGAEQKNERQTCRSFLDRFKPKLEALVEK